MEKYFEKIFKALTNILFVLTTLIILFIFYAFVSTKIQGAKYMNFMGYTMFEVVSGSMGETIKINDLVIVDTHYKNYQKNDIISYESNNEIITHRIIEINGNNIVAKGDANNTEDTAITKNMIIGKVVKIIPNFGLYKMTLLTPKVLISIIVTVFLFSLYFEIVDYNNKKVKKNEEEKV